MAKRLGYMLLFLPGTALFTVVPILAGPSRAYLLMLACAVCGAALCFFAYDLQNFGTSGDPFAITLAVLPVAACYSIVPATLGIALSTLVCALVFRMRP